MAGRNPLKRVSIFSKLGKAELALLQARSSRQRFPENAIVIREGETSDSMCVILTGEVAVLVTNKDGKQVAVDKMGKGDYFGEYALFDGSVRNASVVTTQESHILTINRDAILDMIDGNPESAISIISDLVSRIRELNEKIKQLES